MCNSTTSLNATVIRMARARRERKRGGYRITFLERLEKQKNDSSLSVVGRKKKPGTSNRNSCTCSRTKDVDRQKQATSSSAPPLPMRRKLAEKEAEEKALTENDPTAAKIAERNCQPRKKYRKRNPLADYNKPPVPRLSAALTKPTRLNPLEKSKQTLAGEENHQPESSNGPASSKKGTTTMGEKMPGGKPNAPGAKSNLTEGLSNTPAASSPQLAESNPQSLSCGSETTFLCFFCSETKAVKDRYPGRSNTCVQCHAYYMAQVAAR